jgi:trimethylamine--corrinoid protein Co-methyltransferase
MFTHQLSAYDVLSADAMATLESGWRRLLRDIGIEFLSDDALRVFEKAGQRVEGSVVRFDPDWVAEQVAQAPAGFDLMARNPARSVRIAPETMVLLATQSTPFVRDGNERREGTFADYERLVRLAQVFDEIDSPGYPVTEPSDRPIDSRHLQMLLTLYTDTDKPVGAAQHNPVAARDALAMAQIAFGPDTLERTPVTWGVINANSPMRFDTAMIGSLFELARHNQIVVVTPFILMGAMGPVSIPAALAQQTAEALAGMALAQTIRPGCPTVMGSFVSHTDMQSGSPGFGGPESALGLLASGQIARHLGVPWRAGGGGLTSSQTMDAQAAFEALNTMLPAFLAQANFVLHCSGWLESGLVTCYEKWVLDIEMLRILQHQFTPLEVTEESLAFDAHLEVGHGGHFFGTQHTLERFRDCFYRPLLFSTENYERWLSRGGEDAAARAARRWREALDAWRKPDLDGDILERLRAYVDRRTRELGD